MRFKKSSHCALYKLCTTETISIIRLNSIESQHKRVVFVLVVVVIIHVKARNRALNFGQHQSVIAEILLLLF